MKKCLICYIAILWMVNACTSSKTVLSKQNINSISSIKFLDEYVIPHNFQYQNTIIGGLSGIDYNPASNSYYIISDDRSKTSPARFYTANIHIRNYQIDSIEFTSVQTLKQPNGMPFSSFKTDAQRTTDPESIRFNPKKNKLIWTSEGDRMTRAGKMIYQNPYIYEMDVAGSFKDSFFIPENVKMYATEKGARENGVFEGSSFDHTYKWLFVSMEEPIYDDGPKAAVDYYGAPIRITRYNTQTKKAVAQYGYRLDAIATAPKPADAFAVNGVSEILWIGKNRFLVLERSYSTGTPQNTIKIFLADISKASNVLQKTALHQNKNYQSATKKLLLNLNDLNRYIDNIEGISPGPVLPNGHQSLILIVDNNFNAFEKAQVFLFEIIP